MEVPTHLQNLGSYNLPDVDTSGGVIFPKAGSTDVHKPNGDIASVPFIPPPPGPVNVHQPSGTALGPTQQTECKEDDECFLFKECETRNKKCFCIKTKRAPDLAPSEHPKLKGKMTLSCRNPASEAYGRNWTQLLVEEELKRKYNLENSTFPLDGEIQFGPRPELSTSQPPAGTSVVIVSTVFLVCLLFCALGMGWSYRKLRNKKRNARQTAMSLIGMTVNECNHGNNNGNSMILNMEYGTGQAPTSSPLHLQTPDNLSPVTEMTNNSSLRMDVWEKLLHLFINKEMLETCEPIGEGAFGVVYKAILQTESGERKTVAVKTMKDSSNDMMKEIELMKAFDHPNILKVIGLVFRDENTSGPALVVEFMKFGDLNTVLRNNDPYKIPDPAVQLQTEDLLQVVAQIAQGMRYLADRRFVHRDLACRNCLVGDQLQIKVSDFGMSRDVYCSEYYMVSGHNKLLPVRWMAPESIEYGRYSVQSDVWSFGVTLWEIFSYGKTPYFGLNNWEVANKVQTGERVLEQPPRCPQTVWEQSGKVCLNRVADQRPNFEELVEILENIKITSVYEDVVSECTPLTTTTAVEDPTELSEDEEEEEDEDARTATEEDGNPYMLPIAV